jgi:hypothetical protein
MNVRKKIAIRKIGEREGSVSVKSQQGTTVRPLAGDVES